MPVKSNIKLIGDLFCLNNALPLSQLYFSHVRMGFVVVPPPPPIYDFIQY